MFNRSTPVKVLPFGLVVSKGCPILRATPDARVVDFGCTDCFDIAEVTCTYTKHVTPLDAGMDKTFFMKQTGDRECKLRENHVTMPKYKDKWLLLEQSGVTLLCIPVREFMSNSYVYLLILCFGLQRQQILNCESLICHNGVFVVKRKL